MGSYLVARSLLIASFTISFLCVVGQPIQLPLASNVKYVEADEIGPMFSGIAVVKKGQSFGLINAKGEFVVPYNRYKDIENPKWGMAIVTSQVGVGLIDSTGREIFACNSLNRSASFTNDGYCSVQTQANDLLLIDRKGKKLNSCKFANLPKSGYWFCDNKWASYRGKVFSLGPDWVSDARQFSEGLLIAGKKNQFGEAKYGAVDTSGKTVIPFTFSNPPDDFHEGFAVVTPVATTEFSFAYIDKKGNVRFKIEKFPDGRPRDKAGPFIYGYAKQNSIGIGTPNIYLDTTGVYKTEKEYFALLGLEAAQVSCVYEENNTFGIAKYQSVKGGYGLVNLGAKEICPPYFSFGFSPEYDPISKLTMAEYVDDNRHRTSGLINMKGEFVILKAAKSVF